MEVRCDKCHGDGWIGYYGGDSTDCGIEDCPDCNGTGYYNPKTELGKKLAEDKNEKT